MQLLTSLARMLLYLELYLLLVVFVLERKRSECACSGPLHLEVQSLQERNERRYATLLSDLHTTAPDAPVSTMS